VTHVAMMPARRWTSAIVVLALSAGLSVADPINPADVYVIDGDTIRVAGRTVRLAGRARRGGGRCDAQECCALVQAGRAMVADNPHRNHGRHAEDGPVLSGAADKPGNLYSNARP
jgi:hypothetical protein